MDEFVFEAQARDVVGKQVKVLRREGKLPAIMYGTGIDPMPVTLNYRQASRTLQNVTPSQLVTLKVDGEEHNALVRDRQRDPVTYDLLHVDFLRISMTERLRAEVAIELIGDAPAIEEMNAILDTQLESLSVECLPADLPSSIQVDVSTLASIGDVVTVAELTLPPKVDVLNEPEEIVVVATSQMKEEEEVEEEELDLLDEYGEEPEVIEKGKKEEEEEIE
jgi:large subunit ribosomal protein L25